MKSTEYRFFFKIKEQVLYGGSIRASHKKVELFFHYPYGSNVQSEVEIIDTGIIEDGYLPDHISFHTDGNIHSKARDGKKKKIYFNTLNPGLNVFNLDRANYLPFFVESINVSEARFLKKRFKENVTFDPKQDILYDVTSLNSFSIIFVSKCERLNPKFILENEHLKQLKYIGADVILGVFTKEDKEQVFEINSSFSTDLVILLVENIWEKFPTILHHKNNEEGIRFTTTICMPPVELLGKMINLN
jgi:hypothetical protein